eukprot:2393904-Pyramimonas_sp.AAC.1
MSAGVVLRRCCVGATSVLRRCCVDHVDAWHEPNYLEIHASRTQYNKLCPRSIELNTMRRWDPRGYALRRI